LRGRGILAAMAHLPLLDELAIIAALGVAVTVALSRLRLPAVAGLLLCGAIAGPFGLRLVRSVESIEILAELGVVLLLFTIGLEFSLSRLRTIFKQVAVGGLLQVLLTTLAVAGLAMLLGEPFSRGVFWGFVVALSSTAIVLRALGERRELDAPHGRFIVGTLIFQDLCIVPMVLIVPLLAPGAAAGGALQAIALALGKAALVVVVTVVLARVIVPRALAWVDAARSREAFLLAVLGLCLGIAYLTGHAGLSLALGAFLGGMVVADTPFGHRAMGDLLPLRDAFVSVFFVSLGMLFDVRVVLARPLLVGGIFVGMLVGKGMLATASAFAMRFPARAAILAGVGLSQFGEFGFVLARLGRDSGVVDEAALQPLLAAGIVTMFVTPLLVRIAPHVTAGERMLAPLERLIGVREDDTTPPPTVSGHVVVVGYGVAGQTLALALERSSVPHRILELNAETVRIARAVGTPITYADATSEEALEHAHVESARAVVLLMNDPAAQLRVVETVRRVAKDVPIVVRARYLRDVDALKAAGATEVVPEEVEAGLEIVARVLRLLHVSRNDIDICIEETRAKTIPSARSPHVPASHLGDRTDLADMDIESVRVEAGSRAAGRSTLELGLRKATGATAVALRRGSAIAPFDPATPFEEGDVVYLVGERPALERAVALFRG
jgi:CPA2 family monovalent cation:H+ antiporter-2